MNNSVIWGYIDLLEHHAQAILDLTAELQAETGPRIPLTHAPKAPTVVPTNPAGRGC